MPVFILTLQNTQSAPFMPCTGQSRRVVIIGKGAMFPGSVSLALQSPSSGSLLSSSQGPCRDRILHEALPDPPRLGSLPPRNHHSTLFVPFSRHFPRSALYYSYSCTCPSPVPRLKACQGRALFCSSVPIPALGVVHSTQWLLNKCLLD